MIGHDYPERTGRTLIASCVTNFTSWHASDQGLIGIEGPVGDVDAANFIT